MTRSHATPMKELSQESASGSTQHWLPHGRFAVVAILAALLLIGTAIAATADWLTGEPAPKSVVTDFGSYAPQLGFDPEPGRAVLVAEDDDITLYATTNKQGSYCLITSAPWKRPAKLPDGGTCISRSFAAAPVVAGLVGSSGSRYLIAGRTTDANARAIKFTDPSGESITRRIGSSGFFVASVIVEGELCPDGGWKPVFIVLSADGSELSRASITLGQSRSAGACSLAAPHP